MNLELTLVRTNGYPSKDVNFIDRNRYKVNNDSEALDSICKFISDHIGDLTAMISDNKLINKLETLKSLTIDQFSALRILMIFKGVDILAVYVSDNEVNVTEPPANSIEVNLIDRNNIIGSFIPFATKITQLRDEFKVSRVFKDALSMYGLFTGELFDGLFNPVKSNLQSIETLESTQVASGNAIAVSILNSAFDVMNKDRVIIRM